MLYYTQKDVSSKVHSTIKDTLTAFLSKYHDKIGYSDVNYL